MTEETDFFLLKLEFSLVENESILSGGFLEIE